MTTPTGWKETRGQFHKRRNGDDCPVLELPDVGCAEYLSTYLFEVGPTAGEHAIDWTHLRNWREETGVELSEFEAVTLVDMSRAFASMLHAAREPEYLPPYRSPAAQAVPKNHSAAASAYARAMSAAGDKKKGKK